MWEKRPLFGGAMACEMPITFCDVSDVREVPDHQECWLERNASPDSPGSLLVVEIFDQQEKVADHDAAKFFFQDLAESNEVTSMSTDHARFQPIEPPTPFASVGINCNTTTPVVVVPCFGAGYQRVAMGRKFDVGGNLRNHSIQWISVELCVIRMPHVGTDLLVTLSTPLDNEPMNQEMKSLGMSLSDSFLRILSTLHILDWGLFVHS